MKTKIFSERYLIFREVPPPPSEGGKESVLSGSARKLSEFFKQRSGVNSDVSQLLVGSDNLLEGDILKRSRLREAILADLRLELSKYGDRVENPEKISKLTDLIDLLEKQGELDVEILISEKELKFVRDKWEIITLKVGPVLGYLRDRRAILTERLDKGDFTHSSLEDHQIRLEIEDIDSRIGKLNELIGDEKVVVLRKKIESLVYEGVENDNKIKLLWEEIGPGFGK